MSTPVFEGDDAPCSRPTARSPNLLNGNLDEVVYRGEGDDGMSLVRLVRAALRAAAPHPRRRLPLLRGRGLVEDGSQELQAGDGSSSRPTRRTYEAGPDGVEVLEFRASRRSG